MDLDEDDDRTMIRPPGARTQGNAVTPSAPSPATTTFAATAAATATPAATAQHPLTLPAGTHIAEFEVTQTIGEGGFGIVYLAWDHSLQRKVALKEYMPSSIASRVGQTEIRPRSERHQETFDAGLKSFINEARLLAQFDHPSLLKVYRFWEANGTAYMVMPFLEGATLRVTVRGLAEPPDEAWIVALLVPLFDALTMLHAAQCFHRDIAPDNILLLADTGRPLLLDFGAARRVIGEVTQALTAILKPGYAPIEQYAEIPGLKQGAWTDIYALAAVVHWMITGKTPTPSVGRLFDDSHVRLAQRAAGRYSPGFLEAIDHALAVMPEKRTQTVEEFRDALMGGAAAGSIASPPTAAMSPAIGTAREGGVPRTRTRPETSPPGARTTTLQATARPQRTIAQPVPKPAPTRPKLWLWIGLGAAAIATAAVAFALWPKRPPAADEVPATTSAVTGSPSPVATQPSVGPQAGPAAGSASAVAAPTSVAEPASVAAPPVGAATTTNNAAPDAAAATVPETRVDKSASRNGAVQAAEPRARPPERIPDRTPVKKPPATRQDSRDDAGTTSGTQKATTDAQAECARLFQRLSLGDTDPSLAERVRTLRCR
ncbi:MAG: protein kinase [Caldimonas sp.]